MDLCADFERIMEECVRDRFNENVYSIDDKTIGIDGSPEVAAMCGIPGAVHGGNIYVEQARAVRRVLENNRAAFATGKFPAVNKREPVRVELKEGMPPHYEPPPKAGPAKKEYLYKQMLFQDRHGVWSTSRILHGATVCIRFAKVHQETTTSTMICAPRMMPRDSTGAQR